MFACVNMMLSIVIIKGGLTMKFSEYITSKREEKNLSIRQLALYSDISPGYLSQIESEKRGTPTPDILKKLAKGLKIPYNELMEAAGYVEKEIKTVSELTEKDEKDIAKRMKKMKEDLIEGNADSDGISYMGEPMSEEAIESLLEALEYAERQTTRINKKYIPKKYRGSENK